MSDGRAEGAEEGGEDQRWLVVDGRRWRRQDPRLPADVAERLLSHLASHMYTLLQQGFGYVLGGIDYLFAFTLFSSWLWMCLDEDAIESTIDRVIVGGDTSARVKSVLEATAGILDSLAHTYRGPVMFVLRCR